MRRHLRHLFGFFGCLLVVGVVTSGQFWLWGQQKDGRPPFSPMGTPVLGYVFDAVAGGVRPIVGIPGAAAIREPLDLGFALTYAAISPQQSYALAVTTDKQAVLIDLGRTGISARAIDGLNPEVERAFFSANGKSVALYYGQGQHIQVWSRFPDSPQQIADFDVSQLSGALTALAVQDDSATVLVGFSEEETGSMVLLTPERDPVFLSSFAHPSSALFVNSGRDAVVSDRGSNTIFYVTEVLGPAAAASIASDQDGIVTPVDIGLSADGSRIIVANESSGVTTISLRDGSIQSFASDGVTDGLHRLNGKSVFALGSSSNAMLRIFDGDSNEPRVVVVPVVSPPDWHDEQSNLGTEVSFPNTGRRLSVIK